jgi:hypothetical protein
MSTPATAESLVGASADETPELTHELFLHHMKAMAVHYKTSSASGAGPSHAYALPINLTQTVTKSGVMHPVATPTTAGKTQMDAVLNTGSVKTKAFAQKQRDFVSAQTSKLQTSHDTAGFASQMNAQRAQAKQESDQHIDDMYNQLIDVGTKHPELQQHILTATQKIGAFLTSLLSSVGAFFTDIFNKIMGWINSAVDWIKGAAATAAKWLSGAVSSIGSFFSSIF